jgi:hypothetical protein
VPKIICIPKISKIHVQEVHSCYILTGGHTIQILYSVVCLLDGVFKKSLRDSASGHQAVFTNCEILLIVPENRASG